jgi:aminopeptidase-like protein
MTGMDDLTGEGFLPSGELQELLSPGGDNAVLADEMATYFDRLFPMMRSIAGAGVRQTLDILSEILPITQIEFPSGESVFDWTVPKEWVVREAYLVGPEGDRVIDVADHTLHLLNYSVPFRGKLSRSALDEHLYSLPEQPDAIPYVTSYYSPRWGFCLTDRQRQSLPEGDYEVVIDTDHIEGSLTIGECVLPGESDEEILISTNICHPSLANNELSGPIVSAFLGREIKKISDRRLTYRFVFLPETIGSICYLSRYGECLRKQMVAGYQVVCVGTDHPYVYKQSRRGDALADRAALTALKLRVGDDLQIQKFRPDWGSDERQYCSPGFNLPLGSLMRSVYDEYPEYHNSLDNRDLMSFAAMADSVQAFKFVLQHIDLNRVYRNRMPYGEVQLGKRGLYPSLGNFQEGMDQVSAILWLLNMSDGEHDLLEIAESSGIDIRLLDHFARLLCKREILDTVK